MTKRVSILSFFVLFLFCSFGYAADFNVSDSEEFQLALTTAQSNIEDDVITLSAGYYPIPGEAFLYLAAYNTDEGSLLIKGADGATVTLDGQEKDRVLFINSTADVTLQNLTIKNGNWYNTSGGGALITVDSGDIKVKDCSFHGNTGDSGGAGYLLTDAGDVFVEGNIITGNKGKHGGGIWIGLVEGKCKVFGNTFSDNTSTSRGGGLYAEGTGNMTIENCTFTNNSGGYNGGGVYAYTYYGDFIFRNNLVAGNTSIYEGGGAYFYPEYVRYADIVNNTITGNTVTEAGYYGGGIYVYCGDGNTVYSLYNNIVWDNAASDGDDIYFYDNSYLNYFYVYNNDFSVLSNDFTVSSDLYETANINVDPFFVSATDFRLQGGSPVIGMGDSNAPSLPEIDMDGNARIYGGNVDMGAYEYGSSSTGDDDTTKSTSGGGGGCNAGAFSPALIILLAPLLLLARKK